jgi:hypothetical protein
MLHLLHYPRELIAERVVFTLADHAQIATCRGVHNRLGFAYQLGFLHLTGHFPTQQPVELLGDLLAFVDQELALDPSAMQAMPSAKQPSPSTRRSSVGRDFQQQMSRASCLGLILAACSLVDSGTR